MDLIKTHKALFATLALTMLFSLHYGLPLYATSSFLKASGFTTPAVSLLYCLASLLTLIFSNHITKYLKRYHTYGFTFSVVFAKIAVSFALVLTQKIWLVAFFFTLHFVLCAILFVLLNIFVESFTPVRQTGMVRGVFLTLFNIGILISPLIGGLILSQSDFRSLFIVSAVALVPFFFFLHHYLKETDEPNYESHSLFQAMKKVIRNPSLRATLISQLSLQAFYAVMVIYTPLYVTELLGISLAQYLTVIAPVVLIPLVILPYELGYLADVKYGEKEFMIIGMALLGIMTFLLGVISTKSIVLIIIILFLSRVGAALVETMTYTYYYKKISKDDPSLTNLFTNMNYLASCIVPGFLFLITPLLIFHEGLIFIILGAGILSAIHSILLLKDTR